MRRNSFWAQAILSVGPNRRRFALFFAYWVYTLVVLWLVGQIKSARRLIDDTGPWYRHKKRFSFSDMLSAAFSFQDPFCEGSL